VGIFKGKKDDGKKKPIKVVDVSAKVNSKKKNDTMWCPMHSCTKLACPGGNHS
jgi:hypothetical protein